jgi:hypothetical protein
MNNYDRGIQRVEKLYSFQTLISPHYGDGRVFIRISEKHPYRDF